MALRCGIVGLPNVGKSTLFNALTSSNSAEAANYPFCTIEPNIGSISVPDTRLDTLARMENSAKLIPAQMEFVDIAGLVRGASKGEGLGNQFLGHIREVDAIAYVLRCFLHDEVIHVEGDVNPVRDAEIIKLELALSDLESLEKRLPSLEKRAKNDKQAATQLELSRIFLNALSSGQDLHTLVTPENADDVKSMQLLTTKPFFYVCNVSEQDVQNGNQYTAEVEKLANGETQVLVISAKIEAEIACITEEKERKMFLDDLGLQTSGLSKIARCAYDILKLDSFFTVGPKEAHAWTIKRGTIAPQAAGVIHTDFERGFICAEVTGYDDYVVCEGLVKAKEQGKVRLEGKQYVMRDGDVVHFRFNL